MSGNGMECGSREFADHVVPRVVEMALSDVFGG